MADNGEETFQVVPLNRAVLQLKNWAQKAKQTALAGELIESLEFASQRLEARPLTWGDPLFHYEQLDLLFFRGLAKMFFVYYAVDKRRRIVYIKEFRLIPGHPLAES